MEKENIITEKRNRTMSVQGVLSVLTTQGTRQKQIGISKNQNFNINHSEQQDLKTNPKKLKVNRPQTDKQLSKNKDKSIETKQIKKKVQKKEILNKTSEQNDPENLKPKRGRKRNLPENSINLIKKQKTKQRAQSTEQVNLKVQKKELKTKKSKRDLSQEKKKQERSRSRNASQSNQINRKKKTVQKQRKDQNEDEYYDVIDFDFKNDITKLNNRNTSKQQIKSISTNVNGKKKQIKQSEIISKNNKEKQNKSSRRSSSKNNNKANQNDKQQSPNKKSAINKNKPKTNQQNNFQQYQNVKIPDLQFLQELIIKIEDD